MLHLSIYGIFCIYYLVQSSKGYQEYDNIMVFHNACGKNVLNSKTQLIFDVIFGQQSLGHALGHASLAVTSLPDFLRGENVQFSTASRAIKDSENIPFFQTQRTLVAVKSVAKNPPWLNLI